MTSVVKVAAHCSDDKEVVVKVFDSQTNEVKEEQVLQNGESTEKHIYDNIVVASTERLKSAGQSDQGQNGQQDQGEQSSEQGESGQPTNARTAMEQIQQDREKPTESQQKQGQ